MSYEPYYITTAIFYPNAKPHMGHAIELVQADFLARYHRLMTPGPVRFQTGLDEHGLKMQRTAEAAGMEPAEFVRSQSKTFEEFVQKVNASPDRFIHTTDPDHEALAAAFWDRCKASGDIYKKTYRAWYDVKEEAFLGTVEENPDSTVFGVDEKFIELIEEENYFFACSKYSNKVLDILESGEYGVVPANRRLEMVNFIKDKGLADVSISRERSKLQWGIPVPGDPDQVMYVWFDALTNYLTGASTLVKGEIREDDFWPASLHCVGKDIARFHALLWPAMLLSAGIALPKRLLVHGFVLSGGRRMSKSLGNGVDPVDIVDRYGTDALRWFLLSAMPTQDDGDFTEERLRQVYASDLANDYGNLVSRVLTMCHKYSDGVVPVPSSTVPEGSEQVKKAWKAYKDGVAAYTFEASCEAIRSLVLYCNRKIDECKPWVMAKDADRKQELDDVLFELLEIILHVTLMLRPIVPATAERVKNEVFLTTDDALGDTTKEVPQWGVLTSGSQLGQTGIQLFPRLS